jgi:Domain of unknown function (DUF4157)
MTARQQFEGARSNAAPSAGNERPAVRTERVTRDRGNRGSGVLRRLPSDIQPSTLDSPPLAAPPLVHEVLRSPGQPMDPGTRSLFESSFGHDFSQVRVHTDANASESARTITARAYTVGRNMVFGSRQYAPDTASGRRLIAHELTHVIQQGSVGYDPGQPVELASSDNGYERAAETAAGQGAPMGLAKMPADGGQWLQRQAATKSISDPTHNQLTDEEKARIDAYLEKHQVVVLRKEKHAWLDGQRIALDSLVAQVRREAHILLPDADVIVRYLDAQFYRTPLQLSAPPGVSAPPALTPPFQPESAPSKRMRRGSLFEGTLGIQLLPEDRQRILNFLQNGNFAVGPSLNPMFNGEAVAMDSVIETARTLVLPIILRSDVADVVLGEWSRLVGEKLKAGPLPPPPPAAFVFDPLPEPASDPEPDRQPAFGGQWTWHLNRPGSVERTVQLSLTRGNEVYQFGLNLDTGDAQVLVGVQLQRETPAKSLFHGGLKIKGSAFLQLLAGITTARGSATGSLTFQAQAGVQATATFGPVTVSVQLAPSVTLQSGQGPAVDFNVAPQGGPEKLPEGPFPPFVGIPFIQGRF